MYKREITGQDGAQWSLLSDKEIGPENDDFVVQMKVGTRTAMNFWGTIVIEVGGDVTDEQILAAMLLTELAWVGLLS